MKYYLLFFVILIINYSCTTKKRVDDIEGAWYYFNKDTLYHEVYFTSSNDFRFIIEDFRNTASYKYDIKQNKVYTFRSGEAKYDDNNLLFTVLNISKDSVYCINDKDTLVLKPLCINSSIDLMFSMNEIDKELLFVNRMQNNRIINGYKIDVKQNSKNHVEVFGSEDNL